MNVRHLFIPILLAALTACASGAERSRTSAGDVSSVVKRHEASLRATVESFRPDDHAAADEGDLTAACTRILNHYQDGGTGAWLREPPPRDPEIALPGPIHHVGADRVMRDVFMFHAQEAPIPRRADGGVDWTARPEGHTDEAIYELNRHEMLVQLLAGYQDTNDARYAARIDSLVVDWIIANPYPGAKDKTIPWRGLEVSARATRWARVFYGLQDEDAFSAEARLLMLGSIREHGDYLRRFHQSAGNRLASEMRALATIATAWPEFEESGEWLEYAAARMVEQAEAQVYPDGAQKELTAHYHRITLGHFDGFTQLLRHAGRDVPPVLERTVEAMWDYLARVMRPSGHSPMNNDSDLDPTAHRIASAGERYGRDDWRFIGKGVEGALRGARPPEGLSTYFPYAGHVVMRDGWSHRSHWSFFDVGPAGIAHQHRDKLHLSVSAFGRDLLVDPGRYTYERGRWREYFRGSSAHNVILVDGSGQRRGPLGVEAPIDAGFVTTPEFDFARGRLDKGFAMDRGPTTHLRSVMFLREWKCWVVVDRIETPRARDVEALWHYHPDCSVVYEGDEVESVDEEAGNLRIVPNDGAGWFLEVLEGQTDPPIQGWYSVDFGRKQAAPVASYSRRIDGTTTFAWLLLTGFGPVALASLTLDEVTDAGVTATVTVQGRPRPLTLSIPVTSGEPSVR